MSHRIVVHDDTEHTFEYVQRVFVDALGLPEARAAELTKQIHDEGKAVLPMDDLAAAQLAQEKIFNAGKDPRIPYATGSLMVAIESDAGLVNCGRVTDEGFARLDAEAIARIQRESAARSAFFPGPRAACRPACCCPGAHVAKMAFLVLAVVVAFKIITAIMRLH